MGKSGVFDWQILDFEDIVAVMRFFFFLSRVSRHHLNAPFQEKKKATHTYMHTEILFFFRFFFPILSDCPSTAAAFPRCCTRQHTHIRTRKREEENEGKVYVCVCVC